MRPWMPGGVNRQGIGAGGRVLDYDICDTLEDYVQAIQCAKDNKVGNMAEKAYLNILEQFNTRVMSMEYQNIYENRQ